MLNIAEQLRGANPLAARSSPNCQSLAYLRHPNL